MTKIYCDSGDFNGIVESSKNKNVLGFTTNPTLLAKAGVTDYEDFAKKAIAYLKANRPDTTLSLEVFATDKPTIIKQALEIAHWGFDADYDVYVKIPVVNPDGSTNYDLIEDLSDKININVTAVFTENQIYQTVKALKTYSTDDFKHIISIFAGRIADVGHNPIDKFKFASKLIPYEPSIETLWASTRTPYNYMEAKEAFVDIITMSPDQIAKVDKFFTKDLNEFSIETSAMFANDAIKSGFKINV